MYICICICIYVFACYYIYKYTYIYTYLYQYLRCYIRLLFDRFPFHAKQVTEATYQRQMTGSERRTGKNGSYQTTSHECLTGQDARVFFPGSLQTPDLITTTKLHNCQCLPFRMPKHLQNAVVSRPIATKTTFRPQMDMTSRSQTTITISAVGLLPRSSRPHNLASQHWESAKCSRRNLQTYFPTKNATFSNTNDVGIPTKFGPNLRHNSWSPKRWSQHHRKSHLQDTALSAILKTMNIWPKSVLICSTPESHLIQTLTTPEVLFGTTKEPSGCFLVATQDVLAQSS